MIRFLYCAIALVLATTGCADAPTPAHGQFEVFLLSDTTVRVFHYAGTRLEDLPLAESPWITSADISSYDWETHEIILKPESAGLMGNFGTRSGARISRLWWSPTTSGSNDV